MFNTQVLEEVLDGKRPSLINHNENERLTDEQFIKDLINESGDKTTYELTPSQLDEVYKWVDAVPLSRPKKNIARDFSDGS